MPAYNLILQASNLQTLSCRRVDTNNFKHSFRGAFPKKLYLVPEFNRGRSPSKCRAKVLLYRFLNQVNSLSAITSSRHASRGSGIKRVGLYEFTREPGALDFDL